MASDMVELYNRLTHYVDEAGNIKQREKHSHNCGCPACWSDERRVPRYEDQSGSVGVFKVDLTYPSSFDEQLAAFTAGRPPTLLDTRGKTHGCYADQADITQRHRAVLRGAKNWDSLSHVQKDAIEMISVKLSRIISGDPNHRDHWEDIAGYATLAASGGK